MCFGGGGAAKPTVSASDTVNQARAPVSREPWGPNYEIFQARTRGQSGVRGNIVKHQHLKDHRKLTNPRTLRTTLGGAPATFKQGGIGGLSEVEELQ